MKTWLPKAELPQKWDPPNVWLLSIQKKWRNESVRFFEGCIRVGEILESVRFANAQALCGARRNRGCWRFTICTFEYYGKDGVAHEEFRKVMDESNKMSDIKQLHMYTQYTGTNDVMFNISEWYSHIFIEQRELAHNETSWTKHWNLDDSDCFAWIHPTNQRNHDESWLHHLDSFDACFFVIFFLRKDQTKQTILQKSTKVI